MSPFLFACSAKVTSPEGPPATLHAACEASVIEASSDIAFHDIGLFAEAPELAWKAVRTFVLEQGATLQYESSTPEYASGTFGLPKGATIDVADVLEISSTEVQSQDSSVTNYTTEVRRLCKRAGALAESTLLLIEASQQATPQRMDAVTLLLELMKWDGQSTGTSLDHMLTQSKMDQLTISISTPPVPEKKK